MEKQIHQGHNVRRFREIFDLKQEALAAKLGTDWNQKKISQLEQKEIIDPEVLKEVAKALNIPPEAIEKFDQDAAVQIISNTFRDNSILNGINYYPTFNPVDKLIEVYEKQIKDLKAENKTLKSSKKK